jgi:hypothetical protein
MAITQSRFDRRYRQYAELLSQGKYVEAIIGYIKNTKGVTYAEIKDMLSPYIDTDGEWAIELPGYHNIIMWGGMSKEFIDIMGAVQKTGQIECAPTSPLTYIADGRMMRMPLAKQLRQYKELHWLPVVLNPKKKPR